MSIFRRPPTADVLPFCKRYGAEVYYIFVRSAVFGSLYYGSDQQKDLVTVLMNRHLSDEEVVALSETAPIAGIEIGGTIWCDVLTDGEASDYLNIFDLRLRLVEEVYRISSEVIQQRRELIEQLIMLRIHKRHDDEKRREKWGL